MTRPIYCVLEGIDGCGKDFQANRLTEHLKSNGHNPLRINEPDEDFDTGKILRNYLRSGLYREAHAPLFLANRMELLAYKVRPALDAGRPVVSSRSFLSTLVYQQENWPLPWLLDLHRQLPERPSDIIVLDVDPEEAAKRRATRGGYEEVYEKLEIQKRNRVRYRELMGVLPTFMRDPEDSRASFIDGTGHKDVVWAQILDALAPHIDLSVKV